LLFKLIFNPLKTPGLINYINN